MALSSFGTAGDIIPFARLSRALTTRGHAVTIHSWAHYRSWFPADAAFVPAGGGVDANEVEACLDRALRAPDFIEQVRRFGRLFYGLGAGEARARAYYGRARETFAGHDLAVINSLDHVGQAAAEDSGLRWVGYTSRPPPAEAIADPYYAPVDREVEDLLAAVTGKRRRVRVFRQASPLLNFEACSPQLVASRQATGAWLDPPSPAAELPPEVEEHLAGGPTLLATFGTLPDVNGRTVALVAASAASGWRAIVQVLSPDDALPSVPAGILVVRDRLPFAALLPRVAAVIHHGSVGTVHEVLRAARPSLVLPCMGDQSFWAMTLAERGLGPPPIPGVNLDPKTLAAHFAALRDPEYGRRAAALAPRLAAEDGVATAVTRLEGLA